jgi:ABC-type branched-subunit amino acid transport system ATPase component
VTPILQVNGLTVQFGGVRAVDGVTFDLEKGQILGVIGPNGAGKTTMFDAISGFVPSRGKVALDGETISGLAPESRSRHGLGRSFQDARLFPSLTVAETLAVAFERHMRSQDVVSTALRLPWVSRAEKRIKGKVDDLIGLMGLGAFRDKFINELSTGSRRIVDLAVIMAHDPKVLLLDEPSSGIAQKETEALGPLLLRLRDETGATLIVVEHDMPLIQSVSDELLALETGALLMRGTPKEVIEDPRLVASYLGTDQAVISRSGKVTASDGSDDGADTEVIDLRDGAAPAPKAKPKVAKRTPRKTTAKAPAKKAATKSTATKKVTAKKATSAPKKAAAKKATATRTTSSTKKSAKATTRTSATAKAATKRTPVKKAPAKRSTASKTTGTRAAR